MKRDEDSSVEEQSGEKGEDQKKGTRSHGTSGVFIKPSICPLQINTQPHGTLMAHFLTLDDQWDAGVPGLLGLTVSDNSRGFGHGVALPVYLMAKNTIMTRSC